MYSKLFTSAIVKFTNCTVLFNYTIETKKPYHKYGFFVHLPVSSWVVCSSSLTLRTSAPNSAITFFQLINAPVSRPYDIFSLISGYIYMGGKMYLPCTKGCSLISYGLWIKTTLVFGNTYG